MTSKSLWVFFSKVCCAMLFLAPTALQAQTCEQRAQQYALDAYQKAYDRYMTSCDDNTPPPSSGCVGRLAALRPSWSSSSLKAACSGAGEECVIAVASERSSWGSSSLNSACQGDYNNCAGRLASLRTSWGSSSLSAACSGANADCVINLAQQRPSWGSSSLNNACR